MVLCVSSMWIIQHVHRTTNRRRICMSWCSCMSIRWTLVFFSTKIYVDVTNCEGVFLRLRCLFWDCHENQNIFKIAAEIKWIKVILWCNIYDSLIKLWLQKLEICSKKYLAVTVVLLFIFFLFWKIIDSFADGKVKRK